MALLLFCHSLAMFERFALTIFPLIYDRHFNL